MLAYAVRRRWRSGRGGAAGVRRGWPLAFFSCVFILGLAAAVGLGAGRDFGGVSPPAAWKHFRTLVFEKPPWVARRWEKLTPRQRQMFEDGFLDVTLYDGWRGNAVDPAGERDCTKALNHVVGVGRDFDLVLYFPAGTYLISDTLNCRQTAYVRFAKRKNRVICQGSRVHTCKLYGDRLQRPVIRLQDGAAGFDDPRHPKCIVAMWQQYDRRNIADYRHGRPASCYFAILDGITIDCGRNPGAVGVYWKGAQGSMVANVKILATHAFAGLEGGTFANGGVYGLEIEGGRFGVLIGGNPPCYVGLVLRGQTEAALKFLDGAGPVTLCGFRIEKAAGPVVSLPNQEMYRSSVHGNMLFMDGAIVLADGGTAIDNAAGKNLYLENVYVKGAATVAQSGTEELLPRGPVWTHVAEYAYCNKNTKSVDGGSGELPCPTASLIDGRTPKQTIVKIAAAGAPPAALLSRHLWGRIPEYGDGDSEVVNAVRDLRLDNTGKTCARAALQKAIDKYEKIFLPKGRYRLDASIRLHARTNLFGASPNTAILFTDDKWAPKRETPILITDDDPNGTAVLCNVRIGYTMTPPKSRYFNILTWRVGRRSIVKQVSQTGLDWMASRRPGYPVSRYRVCGGGGGRWYSCVHEFRPGTADPGFHILTIENTTEPLTFYEYGGIHSVGAGDQTVIRNARSVRFIGYNLEPGNNNIFHAIRSADLGFYGFGNTTQPHPGKALVRLTDCRNVRCALFAQPKDLRRGNTNAFQVLEARGGRTVGVPSDRILCLYERDADSE